MNIKKAKKMFKESVGKLAASEKATRWYGFVDELVRAGEIRMAQAKAWGNPYAM